MSNPVLHERASALFLEVRDLPVGERAAALGAADPAVRAEVLSLLEHDLEGPAEGVGGGEGRGLEGAPAQIGPYRILGRLGRGGSGVVLLAQQDAPVRRRVAVKLVPHAAVSPEFAARFEFERRALERTEHPGIARVLDAGRTGDGLPYLVMEYVEGRSITAYCREAGAGLRERIALVALVADAVQHAHQRGVIHRDLKPANVLVSPPAALGGAPLPRILDFGIAKPVADVFGGDSPPTSGLPLGTPAYMAPEQTGGRAVDTRADIYALGAMLYELSCGRPPVETAGDAVSVLQRIRDAVPSPASRVRAQHPELFGDDPLPRSMLVDLDCVLAKALEKDPSRRYETAAAFAQDLRRLLVAQPIEARPATVAYRAARFAQRNAVLVGALSVAAAAVVVGVVGLSVGLVEARRQEHEAVNQGEAQREINRFLTDDLLAASSADREGTSITALDLLHRASRRVGARLGDRPLVAAAIHHTLGSAYIELGAYDDAQRHVERAVALRAAAAGPDAPDTVRSEVLAASLLGSRQKIPEALEALGRVVERARRILGPGDPALYAALNDLGMVEASGNRAKEGAGHLEEAVAGRRRVLGPRDPQVLMTISNLAQVYDQLGDPERSTRLHLEALAIADSLDEPPRLTILGLCNNLGATYQDLNRDAEAAPYLRRAERMAAEVLGPENPDALTIRGNLAGLEVKLGDPARGAELYDGVAKAWTKVLGPDAQATLTARYGYWDALWRAKRHVEAAEGLTALLADASRALGPEHLLTTQTRVLLAHALFNAGRAREAMPYAKEGEEALRAMYGPEHVRTRNAAQLVGLIGARLAEGNGASAAAPKP